MSTKIKPLGDDLIKGEARTIRFTFKDNAGAVVNMTGSTFELSIRETVNSAPVVTIADGSFDKSSIATGIIKVTVSAVQNTRIGNWLFLLWTTFASADVVGQYYTVNYLDKGA